MKNWHFYCSVRIRILRGPKYVQYIILYRYVHHFKISVYSKILKAITLDPYFSIGPNVSHGEVFSKELLINCINFLLYISVGGLDQN